MAERGTERVNKTAYIIYALSFLQAVAGGYFMTQKNDSEAASSLRERVAGLERAVAGLERRER